MGPRRVTTIPGKYSKVCLRRYVDLSEYKVQWCASRLTIKLNLSYVDMCKFSPAISIVEFELMMYSPDP
jgi:hypothetical protein